MRELTEIKNCSKKTPLFREFCKINGLKNGDYYSAIDFLEYCDDLSWEQTIEITRKYEPDFKFEDCNL